MRLLRLISWPYLKKHAVRSLLTVVGIVLGVAVFVAMHTANQAVFYAFERTVDRIAGAAQLQVTSSEAGFPEEVLERVQAIPEVQVAVPVIEAPAATRIAGQGNLLILGVDMTGDRSLRDYDFESGDEAVVDDPLIFLAQPDSIIVTKEFADRNGLRVGDRVTLSTMVGDRAFTVRGIMRSGGLTSAFGGNLAVMDIYAAQQVFGRGRRFDRIDVKLQNGLAVEAGQAAVRNALGVGFDVQAPASRGQQLESTLAVYAISMNISSVFALFIGMFIIYNSFSIAVTQRRSEIGILRALGAPRRQIRNLFLIESAASGLLGSAAGIVLGIFMARGMVGSISNMLEGIYGVAERAEEVSADPRLLGAAIAIGISTEHDCRVAARTKRVARRSGSGAAEGEISGTDRRRESRAPLDRSRPDGRRAGDAVAWRLYLVLRRVHVDHSCRASAGANRRAMALESIEACAQVVAACRGCARG